PELHPAWRAYARALTAESLGAAREHLATVLAIDRRHRPANEMWLPVTLLLDGPAAALDMARRFSAIYGDEPLSRTFEVLALHLLDRDAEAAARAADLPTSGRSLVGLVLGVRAGVRVVFDRVVEVAVGGRDGDAQPPTASELLVAFFTEVQPHLDAAAQGGAIVRLPLGALAGATRAL